MKLILVLLAIGIITPPSFTAVQYCEKDYFKSTYSFDGRDEISVLLIWFPANAGAQTELRLCSKLTGLPLQRHCNYNRNANYSNWEELNPKTTLVNCSAIETRCYEEPFEHNYIMKNERIEHVNNTWKTAQINERANLEKPCLLKTGLPVTRLCEFSPFMMRAQWELLSPDKRNISCRKETDEQVINYDLNNLYEKAKKEEEIEKVEPKEILKNLTQLLTKKQTVRIAADIKLSGDILKIATKNKTNPDIFKSVLNVTDILMATEPRTMHISAEYTKPLLRTLDTYYDNVAKILIPTNKCSKIKDGFVHEARDHFSIFYINPSCSNISGLAIYDSHEGHQHFDAHTGYYFDLIYFNQTLDHVKNKPNLRWATYFPQSLWNKLKANTEAIDEDTVINFFLYENDLFFLDKKGTSKFKPVKSVLKIKIPDFSGELPEDIPFIFRKNETYTDPLCGFWTKNGTWTKDGIVTKHENNSNLLICHSSHLTNFAEIFAISSAPSSDWLTDIVVLNISHDNMLNYITVLCCGLSAFGLIVIWLTALCFKKWRTVATNKVLLNMSLVLTILMAFFLLLNIPDLWKDFIRMEDPYHCMLMGGLLHYIVLVLFVWMLFLAILQYQRLTQVLGVERPSNFIMKFAIMAWGLPLIPVVSVAYFDSDTYMPDSARIADHTGICYPSGKSLYYGVMLPMAIIMTINFGLFLYILYSLKRSAKKSNDKKKLQVRVRATILLFFLIGICWIFGFLTRLDNSHIFSYMFCLTATLQGFVLFIFSIIMDESTRSLWTRLFRCSCSCGGKSYYTKELGHSMEGVNFGRRN